MDYDYGEVSMTWRCKSAVALSNQHHFSLYATQNVNRQHCMHATYEQDLLKKKPSLFCHDWLHKRAVTVSRLI